MRLVWDIDEEWRDVVGAEDRYEVSNKGRVRSKSYVKHGKNVYGPFTYVTKPKLMAITISPDGYPRIKLRLNGGMDRGVTVHRLVAEAFIPNPESLPQVNHKDSNRLNSVVENLEWCTAQENVQHGFDFGLHCNAGEKHPRRLLNDDVVRMIRQLYADGVKVADIAKQVGFKYSTVLKVAHRKNWSHVV